MSLPHISSFDLQGLIDMHIHTGPDIRPRLLDDLEAARAAKEARMRAILLKSHITLTTDRASMAEKVVGGIRVFGGLALNIYIGGFNPAAVEMALKMGAKEIWMPTISAANELHHEGKAGGLTIFNKNDKIRPEIHDIIDLVHHADAILATGHISVKETVILVRLAREQGLRKILVTHPEAPFIRMSAETQTEILGKGVFFERCYVDTTPAMNCAVTIQEIATIIRKVGTESTVLTTDFGLESLPPPVIGLKAYLTKLVMEGFSLDEIRRMAGENPTYLLDL